MMRIVTEKRKCTDCGIEFDAQDIEWMKRKVFCQHRCDSCIAAAQKTSEEEERAKRVEKNAKANKEASICPPLYRTTNPSRLHPKFYEADEAAMNWQYGPQGLGFVGVAGKGKTRAAYLLIQRMLALGYQVQATNAPTFARLCMDQFADDKECKTAAGKELKSIYRADVWFLDDLGKQCITARGEMELYAVLEHRAAQMLPIIWTANMGGDALMRMLGADCRDPIMRRLTEFSDIITVWGHESAPI